MSLSSPSRKMTWSGREAARDGDLGDPREVVGRRASRRPGTWASSSTASSSVRCHRVIHTTAGERRRAAFSACSRRAPRRRADAPAAARARRAARAGASDGEGDQRARPRRPRARARRRPRVAGRPCAAALVGRLAARRATVTSTVGEVGAPAQRGEVALVGGDLAAGCGAQPGAQARDLALGGRPAQRPQQRPALGAGVAQAVGGRDERAGDVDRCPGCAGPTWPSSDWAAERVVEPGGGDAQRRRRPRRPPRRRRRRSSWTMPPKRSRRADDPVGDVLDLAVGRLEHEQRAALDLAAARCGAMPRRGDRWRRGRSTGRGPRCPARRRARSRRRSPEAAPSEAAPPAGLLHGRRRGERVGRLVIAAAPEHDDQGHERDGHGRARGRDPAPAGAPLRGSAPQARQRRAGGGLAGSPARRARPGARRPAGSCAARWRGRRRPAGRGRPPPHHALACQRGVEGGELALDLGAQRSHDGA